MAPTIIISFDGALMLPAWIACGAPSAPTVAKIFGFFSLLIALTTSSGILTTIFT
jgi:hypothetical protein